MLGEVEAQAVVVAACKAKYEEAAAQLDARRARARECDAEIASLSKQRERGLKKLADAQVDAKKLEHKLTRMLKDAEDAAARVRHLGDKYPWIAQERATFGRPGSDYDFESRSPEEAQKEYAALTEAQDKLSKSINKKVLSMFDKAEQEYRELMHKRSIVLNDKTKIEHVIAELDEKKKEALLATWTKVRAARSRPSAVRVFTFFFRFC